MERTLAATAATTLRLKRCSSFRIWPNSYPNPYGAAAIQYLVPQFGRRWPLFDVPFYFLHGQAAALIWALIAYVHGERAVTWIPVR